MLQILRNLQRLLPRFHILPIISAILIVVFSVAIYWWTREVVLASSIVGSLALVQISLQSSLDLEKQKDFERWSMRRDACIKALDIVDASFSMQKWIDKTSGTIDTVKAKINTVELTQSAREAYERLTCSCNNPDTDQAYLDCLYLIPGDASPPVDKLIAFRNLVRSELGLDELDLDRERAYLATILGDDSKS